MKFGFNVPVRGPGSDPVGMTEIARRAESLGYDYIAVTDHIAVPRHINSRYPYTENGMFPGRAGEYLEPLSLMGFLAGVTNRVQLLTSILVVPHRTAVLAAKMISSLDVMSNGRVILGIGAGWMREEFELADQQFAARGRRADEAIAVIRKLAAGGWQQHNGEFYDFPETTMQPEPPAAPRILVGGTSQRALKRAAENDGWISERQSSEEILASLDWIGQRRRELGKADSPFESWVSPIDAFEPAAISALGKKGVTGILTMPWVLYEGREQVPLDAKLSAFERYAREVIQPVKGG